MDGGADRIDLKIGDLALSVQGAEDPVRTLKQVLRFVQRLVEETPEMTGAGVVLDDAAVSGLLADLEAGGGLPTGSFTVTPGLILTAGAPAGAQAAAPDTAEAAGAPAMSAADTAFDDPDSDAPLAGAGAWDDPGQAESGGSDFDAAAAAADLIGTAPPAGEAATDPGDGAVAPGAAARPDADTAMPAGATLSAIAGLGQIGAADRRSEGGQTADTPAQLSPEPEAPPAEAARDPMEPAFARLRTAMSMETTGRTAPGPGPDAAAPAAADPGPPAESGRQAPPEDGVSAPPVEADAQDIPDIFQRVSGDDPRRGPGEMRTEINIFSRGDTTPSGAPQPETTPERVSIAAGAETEGARPLPATAPGWIEDPDEPAPQPEAIAAPGTPAEAPATSRFDALVARYRPDPAAAEPGGEADAPEPAGTPDAPAQAPQPPDIPPDAATLARLSGAEDVADLLAASAASLALGGRSHFSRREVMEAFDTIPGDHPRSLEARIKGYGKLVRSGALVLVEDGLFSLSEAEEDRFRAMLG